MINVILMVIPVLILLILSSALTQRFDYKIEHSNFLVVCSITLFLIFTGLLGILEIGFYIIITLTLISIVYLIIAKFDLRKLFTPSIVFYTIGIFVFSFLIRDIKLFWHDEIVHWALATKSMYYSNTFYKGLQTMMTPTFNYFITKCSGFNVEHMYTGAWMVIWTTFLLPAGRTKWDNWLRVLAYMFGTYCISGYMMKDVVFHIDELLGIAGACLASYWAIEGKKGIKEYVVAIVGLLTITQIKDSYGFMVSIIIAIFIIFNEIINRTINKKRLIPTIFVMISPFVGYFLSTLTLSKPEGYLHNISFSKIPFVIAILNSKVFFLLFVSFIISSILFIIYYHKKRKINIFKLKLKLYQIFGSISLIFLLLLFHKTAMIFLESISYRESMEFINAWKHYFTSSSGGSINIKTAAITIILMGFASYYSLNKDTIKLNIARCSVIIFGIIVMGFAVLVSYSFGFDETGMYTNSVSWERYTSIPFIILITFVTSYLILGKNIYTIAKHRIMITALCLLLVVKYIPYPGAIMYTKYAKERAIVTSISNMVKDDGDIIKNYLDKDDTIFVASYINEHDLNEYGDSRTKWLKYEIAPIKSSWNYFDGYDGDIGYKGSIDKYLSRIAKYDYYYVHSAGPLFYDKFESIFPNNKLYWTKALYKVINSNGEITLEPIYTEEDKLIS